MLYYKLLVAEDGKSAETPGVSWGYGIGSNLGVLARCNDKILLYKKHSVDFGGRGYSEGFAATYMLALWVDETHVRILKEETPGRDWQRCRKALIAECMEGCDAVNHI